MTERRRHPRIGFTTIELLAVIAIIAILLGLMTAGIMSVMGRQAQTQTQQDLVELAQALENFKTRFGIYPPSSLTPSNVSKVMSKLFPALIPKIGETDPNKLTTNINNARSPLGLSTTNVNLSGDQCLVLFLGGYHQMAVDPTTNLAPPGVVALAPQGFSEDPMNPFAAGGTRIGPFFKFNAARLCMRNPSVRIASYGDGFYGTVSKGATQYPCYAYFSTSGWIQPAAGAAAPKGVGFYTDTDCSTMVDPAGSSGGYPQPFINLKARKPNGFEYVNPNSFQIISAGSDTLFGNAYKYPASASGSDFGTNPNSADNFANFYETRMGES